MNEENRNFAFNSKKEVENFEEFLIDYSIKYAMMAYPYLPLVLAYEYFMEIHHNPRAFYALFDLKISFIHLMSDSREIGGTWNNKFSKGKFEGGTIYDHFEKFEGKMKIHRFQTSFILRYRAIWDKIMGFIILVKAPNEYRNFCKSKKKKNTFLQICNSNRIFSPKILILIKEGLEYFDNNFRTPEAHYSGRMRLWTFTMSSLADNPQIELIGFSNYLIRILIIIQSFYGVVPENPKGELEDYLEGFIKIDTS